MQKSKLSIDLTLNEQTGQLVEESELLEITKGCLEVLRRLGQLGSMIEVFRVTWVKLPLGHRLGPCFAIYIHNPLGEAVCHRIDYRFIGSGSCTPSAAEIVEKFEKNIAERIKEDVQKYQQALERVKEKLPKS